MISHDLAFTRNSFHSLRNPIEAACLRLLCPFVLLPTNMFHEMLESPSFVFFISTQGVLSLLSTRRKSPHSYLERIYKTAYNFPTASRRSTKELTNDSSTIHQRLTNLFPQQTRCPHSIPPHTPISAKDTAPRQSILPSGQPSSLWPGLRF